MRALLSFFTVFPFRDASLEKAARTAYLLPLVGLFTGSAGAALVPLAYALPPGVVATLALGAVLLAAGLHHADGVLDVGDALMVRGEPGRRRAVLKDPRVGIGGLGALFVVYAPALAALTALVAASALSAALALVAAEVSARSAMLLLLAFGKPAEAGSSSFPFARSLKGWRRTVGTALALVGPPILVVPLGGTAALVASSTPLMALMALGISRRAFGGIGGDAAGATGEATRAVFLVILSGAV